MTRAELEQVRETIKRLHAEVCSEGGQNFEMSSYAKRTLEMLSRQIPQQAVRVDRASLGDTLALVRLIGDMAKIEKRKVVQLLTHWTKCGLDRRVLIEEMARELATGER